MSYWSGSWRAHAAQIIARVLRETKDLPEEEIKAALFEAYPYGERNHYPYKVWLDEIRRQRGKKRPLGSRIPAPPDPRQVCLFSEDAQ